MPRSFPSFAKISQTPPIIIERNKTPLSQYIQFVPNSSVEILRTGMFSVCSGKLSRFSQRANAFDHREEAVLARRAEMIVQAELAED